MMKVLVLGSDTRSFLTVIRSLGRAGKEVHVAWCARHSVALHSKYVRRVHAVSRPPAEGWEGEFRSMLAAEQFDLIIPCNDPSILPLHGQRELFRDFPIYLVPPDQFDQVMDKAAVNRVARGAGVRLPKEIIIESSDQIDKLASLRPPYVLKPTRSFVESKLSTKNHVQIVADLDAARDGSIDMLQSTPVAVQEYFSGVGVGVEFLSKDGEVLVAFQHERLHEPPGGGGSSYRKSVRLDEDLLEATKRIVEALGYSGIGMAEFKCDRRSKEWIFVELNSRFWGSLPLAVNAGVDFPLCLFDLYCGRRNEFPGDYRVNRTCRNWMLDIRWLMQTVLSNGFSVGKQFKLVGQLISELRYPLTLREYSDTFQWSDVGPAREELREACAVVPRKVSRKLRRGLERSEWVRSRRRNQIEKNWFSAERILFVCKGNICRSPFAEFYFRKMVGKRERCEVASCGYFPKSGRMSPDAAQEAAAEFGIELREHRSKIISSDLVDRADLIFVFDHENREEVRSRYPSAKRRTFLLGEFSSSSRPEIVDPYGGSVDAFRETYRSIAKELDRLFESVGAE